MDSKLICEKKLIDHISSLGWEDGDNEYSDVILKAGEKEYHLHKVILSRSSYFKGLLNWPTNNSIDLCDSGDETKKQVVELSLRDADITLEVFEATLKRLYGAPDLYYEKQDPVKFITAGDYFDIPDMVQMGLESSSSIDYAKNPDFIIAAMNNRYGEYSTQCLSDCFRKMVENPPYFHNSFSGKPEMGVFRDGLAPYIHIRPINGMNPVFNPVLNPSAQSDQFRRARLICGVLKSMQMNKYWKDNATAEKVLRKTLCEKIKYQVIKPSEFKSLVEEVDKENCPFVSSKVVVDYVNSRAGGSFGSY
ncbi:unnamed protein product [Ambrosiozyma monospora]|uniref:Unnamed protein product n=1 Tax=Ambrosiozyma monospora TaxID=43982 RepID=A0ACB5T3S2_AMBMO|nr:unnamed protein product [Ambrosiozyma monospora]